MDGISIHESRQSLRLIQFLFFSVLLALSPSLRIFKHLMKCQNLWSQVGRQLCLFPSPIKSHWNFMSLMFWTFIIFESCECVALLFSLSSFLWCLVWLKVMCVQLGCKLAEQDEWGICLCCDYMLTYRSHYLAFLVG